MARALTPVRVETGLWLLVIGALLAGIGVETDWGRRWAWPVGKPDTTPAPFAKPALTAPYALRTPDAFLETTLRPLFVPTRRPAPVLPDAPKQSMRKDQFILTGTTIVGETKFAHLIEKAGNKSRVVAEGKEINGIKVKQVQAERVILTQYEDTEILVLQTAKTPTPGAPAPASPAIPRR